MDEVELIEIEVACAWPDQQIIRSLRVPVGTTVRQAVRRSGLAEAFSAMDFESLPLGVFGRVVADSYVPAAGERIEIYRPLQMDPREARRLRAAAEPKKNT